MKNLTGNIKRFWYIPALVLLAAFVFPMLFSGTTLQARAGQDKPYTEVYKDEELHIIELNNGLVCVITKEGGISCACPCKDNCKTEATITNTVPVTPTVQVTPGTSTTPEPTKTPPPQVTPEPTKTPPPQVTPEPTKAPANCGVGNGLDGDTPGCQNGRNDGPGTGPGNPGSQGGNGNGNGQGGGNNGNGQGGGNNGNGHGNGR